MNERRLYYYKLVSPYPEDVTKNCKLTINEIDTNFLHLKNMDIKSVEYDEETHYLILTRNNGEMLRADLSSLLDSKALTVTFDKKKGILTILYGGEMTTIDGLVTWENIGEFTKVVTDGTLHGNGTLGSPLGLALTSISGYYKPANGFIDMTAEPPQELPKNDLNIGDTYVSLEYMNKVGLLYDFNGMHQIQQMLDELGSGWRVATKEDWDDMLNSVELCDEARNHDSMERTELGQFAGKLLKSTSKKWNGSDCDTIIWDDCGAVVPSNCSCCSNVIASQGDIEYITVVDEDGDEIQVPKVSTKGIDRYGFSVLPTGYADNCGNVIKCGEVGSFWTDVTSGVASAYVKKFENDKAGVVQDVVSQFEMHGIRLIKEFTGDNFKPVETIFGDSYEAVLMPSSNAEHGFAIWTSMNFRHETSEGSFTSAGDCLSDLNQETAYFVNIWNGCCWEKQEMKEGESIVFKTAYKDSMENILPYYTSGAETVYGYDFRIIDGELIAVHDVLRDEIIDSLDIEELRDKVDEVYDNAIADIEIDLASGATLTEFDGETRIIPINCNFGEIPGPNNP